MSGITGTGGPHVYQAYDYASKTNQTNNSAQTNQNLIDESEILDILDLDTSSQIPSTNEKKLYTRDDVAINRLNSVTDDNLRTVQNLVRKLLAKQSDAYNQTMGMLEIDDETRAEAAELISEDGPLGVKAVSENILNFAKALSGGDPEKIEMLREATKQGFEEVAEMAGGWDKLPDITKQTYEACMKGFDDWAAEAGITPSEE